MSMTDELVDELQDQETAEAPETSLLDETLPPLSGAADLSDDGPGDSPDDDGVNDDGVNYDGATDPDGSPPDSPPEAQESSAAASATFDTLRAIAEAETLCANAEEAVAEAKEVLKEAKAEYDGCVANLRKLAKALRNDSNRPLFDGLGGDGGTATSATGPAASSDSSPGDSSPINTDSDADLHYDNLLAQPLFVLDFPKGIRETLKKAGVETVGDLETLREDIMFDRKKWPRGIGPAKIDVIEDAVIEWLAQNDHDAVPSDVDGDGDDGFTDSVSDGDGGW